MRTCYFILSVGWYGKVFIKNVLKKILKCQMRGIESTNGLVLYLHMRIRPLYFYKKVDKVIVRSLKLKLKFEKKLTIFELT
jgi:hypothetical protein